MSLQAANDARSRLEQLKNCCHIAGARASRPHSVRKMRALPDAGAVTVRYGTARKFWDA